MQTMHIQLLQLQLARLHHQLMQRWIQPRRCGSRIVSWAMIESILAFLWPFINLKMFSLSTVVSRDRNYFLFFESHARLGILTSAYRLLPSFHMKLLKEIILDSIFIDL